MKPGNNTAFTRLYLLVLPAISLSQLSACSTSPLRSDNTGHGKNARIVTVTSSPAGATVRANGEKLGATPLKVDIDKSFPSTWMRAEDYGIVYRVNGKLTLEKSGCESYTIPVSPTEPADDVNVTLACTDAQAVTIPVETVAPVIAESTKDRLNKLDGLYRDGVISTDEYKLHRKRILDEL